MVWDTNSFRILIRGPISKGQVLRNSDKLQNHGWLKNSLDDFKTNFLCCIMKFPVI